jgi:hypothetical protein
LILFRAAFRTASWWTTATGIPTIPGSFFLPFPDLTFMFFVPNLEFLHRSCLVKESQCYTPEKVLQEQYTFVRKDPANGISRLCAFVKPFKGFLTVDLHGSRYSQWIVGSDLLDEFTISWRSCVCYYNKVEGSFFTPVSLESDLYSHKK